MEVAPLLEGAISSYRSSIIAFGSQFAIDQKEALAFNLRVSDTLNLDLIMPVASAGSTSCGCSFVRPPQSENRCNVHLPLFRTDAGQRTPTNQYGRSPYFAPEPKTAPRWA